MCQKVLRNPARFDPILKGPVSTGTCYPPRRSCHFYHIILNKDFTCAYNFTLAGIAWVGRGFGPRFVLGLVWYGVACLRQLLRAYENAMLMKLIPIRTHILRKVQHHVIFQKSVVKVLYGHFQYTNLISTSMNECYCQLFV